VSSINFGTLIPLVIAILAGGAGCILVILAWKKKRREAVTGSWLPTQGVVLSSTVKEHRAVNGNGSDQVMFSPLVRYQYTLGSRTYTGMRVTFSPVQYTHQKAEQTANRYPPSSPVTIYYDPLHPEEAVLEQHSIDHQIFYTLGIVLAVLGLGSMCITLLVFLVERSIH
jgi:hypothetical protein